MSSYERLKETIPGFIRCEHALELSALFPRFNQSSFKLTFPIVFASGLLPRSILEISLLQFDFLYLTFAVVLTLELLVEVTAMIKSHVIGLF